jgi:uncharacterized zinc-type alcohol dehydrogenase-like protein
MVAVNARGIRGPGQPFSPVVVERRELGPRDILIDIEFSGICHTDVHKVRDQAAVAQYPLVPGHEIAGTVSAVGTDVTGFSVGDKAGVGCMVDSCRTCDRCRAGQEQCYRNGWVQTYGWIGRDGERTQGGYSEKIVVDEGYAVRIPATMRLENAAPLLCAGITMYSPLRKWGAGRGTRVAVLGFGGLGHIGVQMAKAMGAHVSVLDLSLEKREDGLRLGADEYYRTTDEGVLATLAESFDIIVSTVPAKIDLDTYLGLLEVDGVYVSVGASPTPLSFTALGLRTNRRTIAGTMIGGIRETQEMIDFCAEHEIGAMVEIVGADRIDEAFARLVAGDVRFRFVIDISTLADGRGQVGSVLGA